MIPLGMELVSEFFRRSAKPGFADGSELFAADLISEIEPM